MSSSSDELRSAALAYHRLPRPGKLEIQAIKPLANQPALAEETRKKPAAPTQVKKAPEKPKIPMASPIRTDMEVYRF